MEKQFVTYDIAKQFKDKGFNEEVFGFYSDKNLNLILNLNIPSLWKNSVLSKDNSLPTHISAPIWQQVVEWFREKHQLDIIISSNLLGYGYIIYQKYPPKNITDKTIFQHYNKALEYAILEAIKLI
jgi:hypothetical protein